MYACALQGLDPLIDELVKPGQFLTDVDYICISDNYWCVCVCECVMCTAEEGCLRLLTVVCA